MGASGSVSPPAFARAVAAMRRAPLRPEVRLSDLPAPLRLAPHAVAIGGEVVSPEDDVLASGRLVVLHDPAGQEAWEGMTRCVAYVRAEVEPDLGADPLLPTVGWAWLDEALRRHSAGHLAVAGTVTRTVSEHFGGLADRPAEATVEVRASWTPVGDDLAAHLSAWADLLATAAGLEPVPPGVAVLPRR